ncbi:MAG: Do family serine endopeptidase, partial [Candidatus Hydrogenedentes bacterium]|nr:Do family serine endopeptidase [Candidatus Hydrogenedentota bacterium]
MKKRQIVVASMLVAVAVALSVAWPKPVAESSGLQSLRNLSNSFADVAGKVKPAVVSVISEQVLQTQDWNAPLFFPDNPFFREFFGDPYRQPRQRRQTPQQRPVLRGLGSGVIIDGKKGYVLTNYHVVKGADKLKVTLADDREFKAEIKGVDPKTDIAVVHILDLKETLPQAELGTSSDMRVGDWVLAIGSPFGLGLAQTVTAGIVSGKGRQASITDYDDFIQTDAAINQGNSGGPLVNLDGQVIGINTWIMSKSGGYDGIGFAIPSDLIEEILPQLIEHGKVRRGKIGVLIRDVSTLDKQTAKYLKIDVDYGAYVEEVVEGDPAEKAGIEPGDVIVSFNGEKVQNQMELRRRAAITSPGTRVKIGLLRKGHKETVYLTMGEMEDDKAASISVPGAEPQKNDIGITVENISSDIAEQYELDKDIKGVVVTDVEPGSAAAERGIKPGAVITKVNSKPVTSARAFNNAVKKRKQGESIFLN